MNRVYTYNLSAKSYETAFILNPCTVEKSLDNNISYESENNQNIVYLPMLGKVACGNITEAIRENDEYFPISKTILGSGEFFILTASGDSMIDAGIDDGDLIIIKAQNTADNRQIVLARIDDETTLKRLIKDEDNRKVILHPENSEYDDLEFPEIEIQGIAIKVIKPL